MAFYISVGKVYREFLAKNGFKNETSNIYQEFTKTGFKSNYELIPDSMLKSLVIAGTPDESKKQLEEFRETGMNLPIVQFNPVGDTVESFRLFTDTFLEKT